LTSGTTPPNPHSPQAQQTTPSAPTSVAGSPPVPKKSVWKKIARRIRVPLGFCFAAVFLWLARPTGLSLALSLLLVLPGLWLRGYAAGYVRKNSELTTTGPYAHTRNPLYLGSMSIAFGFAAASGRWIILIVLTALFLAIYLPTILSEEEFLRATFPNFDAYAARVPRLLPRITPGFDAPNAERGRFSKTLYLHHREYNATMGAAAIYAALALRLLWFTMRHR
jgi:protein-S-isoprenylcysteine O-methyltransferase Ste14